MAGSPGDIDVESAIAVIGMACDFPGSTTADEYWKQLCAGYEAVQALDREQLLAAGLSERALSDPDYVPAGIILEGLDEFDPAFFGLTPREAAVMDPQHRRFLQCGWAALEHAGHTPADVQRSIGVYAGSGMPWYLIKNVLSHERLVEELGEFLIRHTSNDKDFLATRVSYHMDLHGPSLNIQTACSTSLVAIHLACQSLLYRECEMALAGGSTIEIPHGVGYVYREGEVRSKDGRCRAFDADSTGTAFGSGCGVVVLRRLEDALADGDTVYAVVRGSAVNNDGSMKVGYLAPSVEGQAAAIAEALAVAGVPAEGVSYFETHGTGTRLGDPIEIAALRQAFGETRGKQYCGIGSVKTNIGHLDAAAGVASFIKVVQALRHRKLPPSLNFETPNPDIDFADSPFYVNTELKDWETGGGARRAGVASLGVGGTNAYAVLEEWPQSPGGSESRSNQLLVVSAKTSAAARRAGAALAEHLRANGNDLDIADAAYTLSVGRVPFEHRGFAVMERSGTRCDALQQLKTRRVAVPRGHVVFMFSGQGSQYPDMARALYETEPCFRRHVEECFAILRRACTIELAPVLFPDEAGAEQAAEHLQDTRWTQPALFVIEYALAQLWMHWGIKPSATIGHSVGEYVAACLSGVFQLDEALRLICARGALVSELPRGSMIAVPLSRGEVEPFLDEHVSLAAVNAPELCVLSGTEHAIDAVCSGLDGRGIMSRRLRTSHAFHSAMLDPIVEKYRVLVESVALRAPQIPCISNLTGTWMTERDARDPGYWSRHLREPVLFTDGLRAVLRDRPTFLLEVGPGDTLKRLAEVTVSYAPEHVAVSSLPSAKQPGGDAAQLLNALGELWTFGVEPDWAAFWAGQKRSRIGLPAYQFARDRFWLAPVRTGRREAEPGGKQPLDDWFYVPTWQPAVTHVEAPLDRNAKVVLFLDGSEIGAQIAADLEGEVAALSKVVPGEEFEQIASHDYRLNPGSQSDYRRLLEKIGDVTHVVHAWSNPDESAVRSGRCHDPALERGFFSLLFLAQALAERDSRVRLLVLTENALRIRDERKLAPHAATVLGPARVIPEELAHIECKVVDVSIDEAPIWLKKYTSRRVVAELAGADGGGVCAYRGRERFVERFERVRFPHAAGASLLEREGVYIVTGAFGGLGRVVAEFLARQCGARLVLIGRSEPADCTRSGADPKANDRAQFIRRLEALGSEVLALRADVTSEEQVTAAVDRALRAYGRIDGVFHVAGAIDDGLLTLKSAAAAARVLAPKIQGTLILDRVVSPLQPKVFVLFSSLSSIAGLSGQADYAAANAFLDSFAQARSMASATHYLAVNWSVWKGVGMASRMAIEMRIPKKRLAEFRAIEHPPFSHVCVTDGSFELLAPVDAERLWCLDEHRLKTGEALMPGAGYVDLICSAFALCTGERAVTLSDLAFLVPLIVPDGDDRLLSVRFERESRADSYETVVRSLEIGQEDAIEHVRCRLAVLRPDARQRPTLVGAATLKHAGAAVAPTHAMLEFGPRWRCLTDRVLEGSTAHLALSLEERFADDLSMNPLHPAMLDVAMAGAQQLVDGHAGGRAEYAPFLCKAVNVFGPLERELRSRVVLTASSTKDTPEFDIAIFNTTGTVLVEVERLRMRALTSVSRPGHKRPGSAGMNRTANRIIDIGMHSGITSAEGREVLGRLLACQGAPQVIVCPQALDSYLETLRSDSKIGEPDSLRDERSETAALPRPELSSAYQEAEIETERSMIGLWEHGLGVEGLGIDDNFFELGGHSLLLTQLVARVRKQLGLRLPLEKAFELATVRHWAKLAERSSEADDQPIRRVDRSKYRSAASVLQRLG